MLISGLPCLPWFAHSGWNLAFGVLPPYWVREHESTIALLYGQLDSRSP
jgi:hypothetical protein